MHQFHRGPLDKKRLAVRLNCDLASHVLLLRWCAGRRTGRLLSGSVPSTGDQLSSFCEGHAEIQFETGGGMAQWEACLEQIALRTSTVYISTVMITCYYSEYTDKFILNCTPQNNLRRHTFTSSICIQCAVCSANGYRHNSCILQDRYIGFLNQAVLVIDTGILQLTHWPLYRVNSKLSGISENLAPNINL